MLDVVEVEFDLVLDGNLAASLYLCPTRDPWSNVEAALLAIVPQFGLPLLEGARADQAHLPEQDIEQLRHLVEGAFSQ